MPCPIKKFNLLTGKVELVLEKHKEEILSLTPLYFKKHLYLISTSQDGTIVKWKQSETGFDPTMISDGETCMVFNVSFIPKTGNRYFIASCDDHVRIYDFELGKVRSTSRLTSLGTFDLFILL
jgi:WD40 repeat protein